MEWDLRSEEVQGAHEIGGRAHGEGALGGGGRAPYLVASSSVA